MAKFITIGYGDNAGYQRTNRTARDAAHAFDAQRVRKGDVMGIAGKPMQVRNHDGLKTEVTAGAYLSAALPVAGFAMIEAPDLEGAIEIASHSPCAVNQGVVEVWPLEISPSREIHSVYSARPQSRGAWTTTSEWLARLLRRARQ